MPGLDDGGSYADAYCAATARAAGGEPDGCNACGRSVPECAARGCDTPPRPTWTPEDPATE